MKAGGGPDVGLIHTTWTTEDWRDKVITLQPTVQAVFDWALCPTTLRELGLIEAGARLEVIKAEQATILQYMHHQWSNGRKADPPFMKKGGTPRKRRREPCFDEQSPGVQDDVQLQTPTRRTRARHNSK